MLGTTLLNRYRIDAELGQGGMGMVYRAHDTLLHRPVAVKVLLSAAGLGTEGKARLLAEARAAARLNHPNIVNVYDAGEAQGSPFIVMELVEGLTLRLYRPASLDETLNLARQICAALEHAHANGIIHRDLKPENVVLTKSQTLKLMDFGLARTADADAPRLTEEGALMGTFAYLAPELIQGQPASAQSDLYALGVMLYELATGRPPFMGDALLAVLSQHLHAPVTPPSAHNSGIPAWLDEVIVRLLSKLPEDRPTSAGDVLQRLVTADRRASVTSGKQLLPPPNNLPTKLSTFIGREKELARLQRLLSPHAQATGTGVRAVTLTGSGGIGKTRLSIQAARELLPHYPHGAWLVELAPLTDPVLVPQTVCAVLDVQPQGNISPLTALADYLREKTVLLVLDNCEHLIDACAQLAEHLLTHCPDVYLLASSREALGIEGETSLRVPSLSLPDTPRPSSDALQQSEAVRLFVERAAAALPGFALTDANAPVVAQVCRRLDGIALAIELAAARVKMLKVEQIATRLDDAFRLLTGGSRTALPRQQTLRATIDWSFSLLSDAERGLLQQLAVFAGGWTLEAAESVCVGEGVDKVEVLDLLTQLANKSLVVVEREQGKEARYFLLETTRQYAREKLLESGEGDVLRRRHAEYYLAALVEANGQSRQLFSDLGYPYQVELDNFRVALTWSNSVVGNAELGLRLASGIWNGLEVEWSELRGWLEGALAHAEAEGVDNPSALARVLFGLGYGLAQHSDFVAGEERLTQSLGLFQALDDHPNSALAFFWSGWIAREQGNAATARLRLEAAQALWQELNNHDWMAHNLNTLAQVAVIQEDTARATALLEEALALHRQLGNSIGLGWALNHLGHVAQLEGDYERAMRLHEESLTLFHKLEADALYVPEVNQSLGEAALAWGDAVLATKCFSESLTSSRHLQVPKLQVWCVAGLAGVAAVNKQPERAAKLWGAAETLRQSIGARPAPATRVTHERFKAIARAQLGEAAFDAAWAQGQSMTLEQAVAYALEEQAE